MKLKNGSTHSPSKPTADTKKNQHRAEGKSGGAVNRLRAGLKSDVDLEMLARMNSFSSASTGISASRPRIASPIRIAIVKELNRRNLSGYALWKLASKQCRTLSQAAVYEFLRGNRSLGLEYLDALLVALDLSVSQSK